jgi:hypothetical protein
MAKDDDDKYKEGVDFEWVQGNNDENSGFKTRRFFTKAEKKARSEPKVEAPKAVKKKTQLKGITTPKITTTKLDQSARPEGKPAGMPSKKDSGFSIPGIASAIAAGAGALALRGRGSSGAPKLLPAPPKLLPAPPKALPAPAKLIGKDAPKPEAKTKPTSKRVVRKTISPKIAAPQASAPKSQNSRGGGKTGGGGTMMGGDPMFRALGGGGFGSLEDLGREALLNMKKGGVVKMKEGSAKDMREDKMKAKKAGMSMKTWEKSAADKKHDAPKKMAGGGVVKKAGGGSMRGAGCAVRGKGFSGSY